MMKVETRALFFPQLTRRPETEYYSQKGDFYSASNYQSNYRMVAEDCRHRCVYCDATERECGGERFSLDHFRPKDLFVSKFNGILVKHPYNLHLSCQKCNVLKSKDWQGCKTTIDGHTHSSGKGYVDRFREDVNKYLVVQENGRVIENGSFSDSSKNPAQYMIERLHLNRPSRIYLRQKRIVKKLIDKAESLFSELTHETILACEQGDRTAELSIRRIKKIEALRTRFRNITT